MDCDVIVVGGGSAGCAMAGRLAESGKLKVLLIEAGRTDRHMRSRIPALTSSIVQNPDYDWVYQAEPDDSTGGRADIWPGGKQLGGGSALNGMMFIRGHRWDYDNWARLGAKGWDYESVLPYFRRMESNERGEDLFRGGSGPQAVSEVRARYSITDSWIAAAVEAGIERCPDLNGERAEGVDYVQVSQKNGLRHSTATAYIHSAKGRSNLAVELNAQVTRIVIENGRAAGVEIAKDGQVKRIGARAGVVLSAGSMNTPRLLMLSGVGPAGHLKEMGIDVALDLPGVGGNLQEHVGTHLVNTVDQTTLNSAVQGLGGAAEILKFVFARKGALTTPIGHAQAFVKTRPDLPAPNVQIAFAPFAFDFDAQGRLMLRKEPSISQMIGVMRPKSRGRISLRSPDPFAPPVIRHRLLGEADDLEQLCEGLEIARRIVDQPSIKPHVTSEVRPGVALNGRDAIREYCRMACIPLYHPVGTTKIGAESDPEAVVDADLKVRGVDGLFVADASVMPSLTAGNTNATCIMIGDKGAEHVLKRL